MRRGGGEEGRRGGGEEGKRGRGEEGKRGRGGTRGEERSRGWGSRGAGEQGRGGAGEQGSRGGKLSLLTVIESADGFFHQGTIVFQVLFRNDAPMLLHL